MIACLVPDGMVVPGCERDQLVEVMGLKVGQAQD